MELAALVALTLRLLRQLNEVPHGLGDGLSEQSDFNTPRWLIPNGDIKPYLFTK